MHDLRYKELVMLLVIVGKGSILIEGQRDQIAENQASPRTCSFPTSLGQFSDMDNEIMKKSLNELRLLSHWPEAVNISTLCSIVKTIAEKHLNTISLGSSTWHDIESNRTVGEDEKNLSKSSDAQPSSPGKGNSNRTEGSQLSRVVGAIVTTIISHTRKICIKKGGIYNQQSGECDRDLKVFIYDDLVSSKWIYIISLCGNSSSVVALVALLAVYIIFKELRTLPGKNVMCLSVTMLTVHILQFIAMLKEEVPTLCRIIAVLLHWAYMWSFVWMSIISFDFLKTFGRLQTPVRNREQFRRYVVVAASVPTFVVLIYIIIDISTDQLIGYGVNNCFVLNYWPNVSFIGYIALTLLFNIGCIIAVTRTVYKSRKFAKKVLSQESKRNKHLKEITLMVLRISTLIGTGWVFCVLGSSFSNAPLYYIFLVLVDFQGVLVFVAFVCNKRVYNRLKLLIKTGSRTLANQRTAHTSENRATRRQESVRTVTTEL